MVFLLQEEFTEEMESTIDIYDRLLPPEVLRMSYPTIFLKESLDCSRATLDFPVPVGDETLTWW